MSAREPIIALIGRPNVGKSTLFNLLARGRRVITHDQPGVTRDRNYGRAVVEGRGFRLVDTGGIMLDNAAADLQSGLESPLLREQIFLQVCQALAEADAVILLTDGREGLSPLDERLAEMIRQSGKPCVAAVNKIDAAAKEEQFLADFYRLGLPLVAISAAHNRNIAFLCKTALELCGRSARTAGAPGPAADEEDGFTPGREGDDAGTKDAPLRVSLLGRPNVGKSSLINTLVGSTRMIVSELAGTTRDSIDVEFAKDGRQFVFIDTAGVRRRNRVDHPVEQFSVSAALESAQRADISLLLLDAAEGVTVQDKKLISFLDKYKIAFIVLVNKIDLIKRSDRPELLKEVRRELAFSAHVPIFGLSTLTGAGLDNIFPSIESLWRECSVRIGTGVLNRAAKQVIENHQPPMHNGRRAKFYYLTQAEAKPPTFIFFVNDVDRIKDSYARYLEKSLRKLFDLKHAPLRLVFRTSQSAK